MKFPVIDGHADTALEAYLRGGLKQAKGHLTLDGMKKLDRYAQFFAFCPVCHKGYDPERLFAGSLSAFEMELSDYADTMTLCTTAWQMLAAWEEKKTAAFLALEGAEGIGCDPGRLEEVRARGFTMVSLMWNYENSLGGSNQTGNGLTARGREFVRKAHKLGMIVDVSHASDAVFYEICELAEGKVVASHSNCRRLCNHPRNLTDDQLRCLSQLGGTVGVNFWPDFLTCEKTATYDDICRHLDHMISVGGEDIAAFGGDMDGIDYGPEGFSGVEDYENILDHLARNGFSCELLEKISYGNLYRVLRD